MKITAADLARSSTIDQPYARVLEAADWRDLNDYTAGTFVYVAGYAYQSPVLSVAVARRGQHELSHWQKPPPDGPLSMTVVGWKPLPDDGISLYERERWLYGVPDDGAYVRPPEPIYEAGGINARLSPVPRELLIAIAGRAVLRERAFRWTEWSLQRPGSAPARGARCQRLAQGRFHRPGWRPAAWPPSTLA